MGLANQTKISTTGIFMTRYYAVPFADVGDKLDIPDAIQPSGSVSYEQGYGSDYSLSLAGGPPAKAYPRNQSNQFSFDITENAQKFQQFSAPEFIPSMDNAPVTFPYDKGVIVRYDAGSGFNFYQSLANANTALPTDTTKWRLLDAAQDILVYYTSNFGAGVVTGDIVTFSSVTGQFEKALAGNSVLQNAAGVADVENNYIQIAGVYGGFTGLTPGAEYYLSSSVAGGITLVDPADAVTLVVGYAFSSTELFLNMQKDENSVIKYGVVSFNSTTTQSIAQGDHVVQFNNVIYDPLNWWVSGSYEWRPTIAGLYRFSGCVFSFNNSGGSQGLKISKNGTWQYWLGLLSNSQTASDGAPCGTSPPIYMNGTTDYAQLLFSNEIATSTTIGAKSGANGDKNFFFIEYLGK